MNVCAVIVAAGQGTRLGLSTPKAFIELGGRPLFTYCLGVLAAHPSIGRVVIVGPPERLREMGEIAGATAGAEAKLAVVAGGAERWQSVRNGVAECSAAWEWILVHDAARPFVTRAVVDALLEKARSLCVSARRSFSAARIFFGHSQPWPSFPRPPRMKRC
jgi:2-C-methyl-D-erythritol 4-phosphate cytidylyltransferase